MAEGVSVWQFGPAAWGVRGGSAEGGETSAGRGCRAAKIGDGRRLSAELGTRTVRCLGSASVPHSDRGHIFKSLKTNPHMVVEMQVRAIYEDEVLKPLKKLDLPDKAEVKIIIRESFSKLLDEVGEEEAKEDVDLVLKDMRARNYYE